MYFILLMPWFWILWTRIVIHENFLLLLTLLLVIMCHYSNMKGHDSLYHSLKSPMKCCKGYFKTYVKMNCFSYELWMKALASLYVSKYLLMFYNKRNNTFHWRIRDNLVVQSINRTRTSSLWILHIVQAYSVPGTFSVPLTLNSISYLSYSAYQLFTQALSPRRRE